MIEFFQLTLTLVFCTNLYLAHEADEFFCQKSNVSSKKTLDTCRLSENYQLSFTKALNNDYDLSHNYYLFSNDIEAQIFRLALNGKH